MDSDFFASGISEDEEFQYEDADDDIHQDFGDDGERCGICMDVVIDRGVLDCCQHWFCFQCIDNWATITNLCPLCQNEFQLITCVPVYDAIGSNKGSEESASRDDEWSIEGKNNGVSFPSYYIDENAVVCLDGDGCKIRSGMEPITEDTNMDTSIACDSCDLWYHAFCVGFDTDNTSESTWLCPRCADDEPQKSDETSMDNHGSQFYPVCTEGESCVESSYSKKVSVYTDTGEPAVVVSVIAENQCSKRSTENSSNLEVGNDPSHAGLLSSHDAVFWVGDTSTHELDCPILSSSCSGYSNAVAISKSKVEKIDEVTDDQRRLTETEDKLNTGINYASSMNATMSEGNDSGSRTEIVGNLHKHNMLNEPVASVCDGEVEPTKVSGLKRKVRDRSAEIQPTSPNKDSASEVEMLEDFSKRPRTHEMSEMPLSLENDICSMSDSSMRTLTLKAASNSQKLSCSTQQEGSRGTDIMTIIQESDSRLRKKGISSNPGNDASELEKENGRRVKKILRRPTQDKDSSMLVQKLRQEIREAARDRSEKDFGGDCFKPELLAAFRAAVSGQKSDQTQKLSSSVIKVKKTLLQKGTVRENLTKKIYATNNGRRKRAWDRDCEIEFWKHRCMQASKPETVETLKSVLNLLRGSSEGAIKREQSASDDVDPILSRLYLADASVFPRKDDIKSVVALKEGSVLDPNKGANASAKGNAPVVNDKESFFTVSNSKGPITSSGLPSKGLLNSKSSALKPKSQKESGSQSHDIRSDKKRWALEVLARKTAKDGQTVGHHENLETDALFKANYPILAQLPIDMRPQPTNIRRNKIPMTVRQTQLYRFAEHLLKKANMQVVCRTAASELAVADAVNIEKGIADRSSSKIVYVNLCSQEVLRHSDSSITEASNPVNLELSHPIADAEPDEIHEAVTDHAVEEALKNTGLISESPPGSPQSQIEGPHGKETLVEEMKEEGPDNAREIDSRPELETNIKCMGVDALDEPKIEVLLSALPPDSGNSELNGDKIVSLSLTNTLSQCPVKEKIDELCPDSTMKVSKSKPHADQEEVSRPEVEPQVHPPANAAEDGTNVSKQRVGKSDTDCREQSENPATAVVGNTSEKASSIQPAIVEETNKEKKSEVCSFVSKKAEAYIKEHIRPLCKSGVITAEQYRWAVAKTTEKVMKYHAKDKNANFLIKEGEKVKKLAQQYVEAAQKNKSTTD